ncbi:hypothetical protein M0811_07650 [Anaeramoeba ignava]|uniref:Uncharacterized protein n=1 Tax=Anaeramoeba ignava TaxID=1746090 RepID=A0A9Q0LK46_ANAIG|nr:hypothetical protein M0811_07650 [Anaeramoeba ignava]
MIICLAKKFIERLNKQKFCKMNGLSFSVYIIMQQWGETNSQLMQIRKRRRDRFIDAFLVFRLVGFQIVFPLQKKMKSFELPKYCKMKSKLKKSLVLIFGNNDDDEIYEQFDRVLNFG